ncbi:MAG: DUF2306 domain-containing protein [Bacteroidia bacterium]
MLKKTGRVLWLVLVAICCWLMIDLTLPYLGFETDVDFLLTKQKIIHIKHWRYSFYVHILFSCFALAAGLTQFSDTILKKFRKLHRLAGYVYVADILFLAGPSGLIMGCYANGTLCAKTSFVLLAALWIMFTVIALQKALVKDFTAHRSWMIRSYALTLSAITLRLFALLLPRWVHMEAFTEYTLIAWLSWTVNLAIAELIILFRKRSTAVL